MTKHYAKTVTSAVKMYPHEARRLTNLCDKLEKSRSDVLREAITEKCDAHEIPKLENQEEEDADKA